MHKTAQLQYEFCAHEQEELTLIQSLNLAALTVKRLIWNVLEI